MVSKPSCNNVSQRPLNSWSVSKKQGNRFSLTYKTRTLQWVLILTSTICQKHHPTSASSQILYEYLKGKYEPFITSTCQKQWQKHKCDAQVNLVRNVIQIHKIDSKTEDGISHLHYFYWIKTSFSLSLNKSHQKESNKIFSFWTSQTINNFIL